MRIYTYPSREEWPDLLRRPRKDDPLLRGSVGEVLADVRQRGDEALREYELRFDGVALSSLEVSPEEKAEAERKVPEDLKAAIGLAKRNIETFHRHQAHHSETCQTAEGVQCWQRSIPIERVGLYVPGGTAPLFSTVLMLATPARLVGCRETVLCTPPQADGSVNAAVLHCAAICGVDRVFKVGGAQAIAAMAYGTQTVPKVHKIFGPGNQYVTCAKQMVSFGDVAIDMPAGPSEVMVLADAKADVAFVASDLLSQAEHGVDSQVLLLTTSEETAQRVSDEVERQLKALPRRETASAALSHSRVIVLHTDEEMMEMANLYAPEHLIIETENYRELADRVVNAGSVFLGSLTPESAGDYASGTNHTLPTNGHAVAYSGVNLDAFCRKVTFQHIEAEGIRSIARAVETMAQAEGLDAHRHAMELRRRSVEGEM